MRSPESGVGSNIDREQAMPIELNRELLEVEEKELIEASIQELLSTKHLYQNVTIDFTPAVKDRAQQIWAASALNRSASSFEEVLNNLVFQTNQHLWFINHEAGRGGVQIAVPPVRTLCSICKTAEPFNPYGADFARTIFTDARHEQMFCLTLQCQGCRRKIIVFLISRVGNKIQLTGRSEIERVVVPPFIINAVRKFYSDAVIAYHAGQHLAGVFLLRTVIERFMRLVTKTKDEERLTGDELCGKYAETLPKNFREQFPSMKEIYEELSGAMHSADAGPELFKSQRHAIERHFDALRLFNLHQL